MHSCPSLLQVGKIPRQRPRQAEDQAERSMPDGYSGVCVKNSQGKFFLSLSGP